MKQNVWILNHYAGPPEICGGIRHFEFAKNLIQKGYKVKVFAANSTHKADTVKLEKNALFSYQIYDDVPFIFIKARNYNNELKRIFNMIDFSRGLLKASRKFDNPKPDVILASSVHPLTWLSGLKLAKRYKAEFIAETRDLWPATLISMEQFGEKSIPAKILYAIEKKIYTKADKLIFTIPGGKDYLKDKNINRKNVFYINNGVNLESFQKNINENQYKDPDLYKKDTFKVIYTGAISKFNGLLHLAETAKLIQNNPNKKITFLIWGDGTEKEKLRKKIKTEKIKNMIIKDNVEKKYIPSILNQGDANLLLGIDIEINKYGISPNKLFDYFAAGKPVISNKRVGYDIIEKYNAGITVKDQSIKRLANSIIEVSELKEQEYGQYCNNSKKAALEFDFKELTDKLISVIEL